MQQEDMKSDITICNRYILSISINHFFYPPVRPPQDLCVYLKNIS